MFMKAFRGTMGWRCESDLQQFARFLRVADVTEARRHQWGRVARRTPIAHSRAARAMSEYCAQYEGKLPRKRIGKTRISHQMNSESNGRRPVALHDEGHYSYLERPGFDGGSISGIL
jgi:hypothetical protein